eukprot:c50000_g1_i1 orf=109-300(+)
MSFIFLLVSFCNDEINLCKFLNVLQLKGICAKINIEVDMRVPSIEDKKTPLGFGYILCYTIPW